MLSAPRLSTRALQALNTQAIIVDAAEELFCARGFAGASLADIAEAARVSKPLILHHFRNKDALWSAVVERHLNEIEERLRSLLPQRWADHGAAKETLLALYQHCAEHPTRLRFLVVSLQEHPSQPALPDPEWQGLSILCAQAQNDGLFSRAAAAETQALLLCAAVRSAVAARRNHHPQSATALIDAALRGLAP